MPNTDDILKAAMARDKFLSDSVINHQRRFTAAIEKLEEDIVSEATAFKMTGGTLDGPRINMRVAQKIHAKLAILFDETYGKEARRVIKDFDKIEKYILNEFKQFDFEAELTSVDKDVIEVLKKNTWVSFNQFGLQSQSKLVDTMYMAIIGRSKFSEMVNQFRGILSGHKDVKGRPMSIYAELYANDAIMNFHNALHMKKAEDLGMEYFLYYGSLMATSRPFCIERASKVFSKDIIQSWTFDWKGKAGPALTHRGGYNCRHSWGAVRKSWLDSNVEVIE